MFGQSEDYTVKNPNPKTGTKILLVDDNSDILNLTKLMFELMGHSVTTATNGKIAVDLVSKGFKPDIIFMDVEMPVMDGLEACRNFRKMEQTKDLYIAAVTGSSDKEETRKAGFNEFFCKPVEMAEFDRCIKKNAMQPVNT